ncbi:MAG: hypothetical protein ACFFCS_16210 [Candidatus Hodarchaeota archaeon]
MPQSSNEIALEKIFFCLFCSLTISLTIIVIFNVFPTLLWALVVVEDPWQGTLFSYLYALVIFLGSCAASAVIFHFIRNKKVYPIFSIIWLVLAAFWMAYLISIYKEFYPFTDYQVTIFQIIMALLPPAVVSMLKYVSASRELFTKRDIPAILLVSGVILVIFHALETIWWGYYALVIPLILIIASPIATMPGVVRTLTNRDFEDGEDFSDNRWILGPIWVIIMANTPMLFEFLFKETNVDWGTSGLFLYLGTMISVLAILLLQKRKYTHYYYTIILPGFSITCVNLLLSIFLPDHAGSLLSFILIGLSYGFLLLGFFKGVLFGIGERRNVHFGFLLLNSFLVVGLMAVLDYVLGELGLNQEERRAIFFYVKIGWLVLSGNYFAVITILHFAYDYIDPDYPVKFQSPYLLEKKATKEKKAQKSLEG